MKNKILLFFLFSAFSSVLFAQEAGLPIYGIKEFTPENWYSINSATLDSVVDFDFYEAFGLEKNTHLIGIQGVYMSSHIVKGKRAADSTFMVEFFDRGPLFAGEGYWNFQGFLPEDSQFAKEFNILGGWKYNLTEFLVFDIGGNVTLSDKKVNADGRPAKHYGEGEDVFGDVYFGLIGDCFLEPFVYFIYDFTFYQKEFRGGFAPKFDLEPLTAIEGLSLEILTYGAYTVADRFSGRNQGDYWHNSYTYFYGRTDLVWASGNGLRFSAGVGYTYNNDGSEFAGPRNSELGSDSNVFFRCSIGYSF